MTKTSGATAAGRDTPGLKTAPTGRGNRKGFRVKYSQALAKTICAELEAGKSMAQVTRGSARPARTTLYYWRDTHPEFAQMLLRAQDIATDAAVEAAMEIAAKTTKETVAADRLKINTLLWRASHGAPRRWGGKADAAAPASAGTAAPAAGRLDEKAAREIRVRIRRFVPVVGEDGKVFTREILADGGHVDHGR